MKIAAAVLALALAAPALAQEAMTGAQFEAYTTGKTLTYGTNGEIYGGEDYLPGRNVRWSFLDGRCLDGRWYDAEGQICFVYVDDPNPVCWEFFETPSGLIAYLGGDGAQALYEIGEADAPLSCIGPKVGV